MGDNTRRLTIRPVRRGANAGALVDAAGVADVLNNVIAQKRYTALAGYWTPESELAFLQSMGPRSEMFVAEQSGRIVGFQVIEPFVTYTPAMEHVAQMGTYVHDSFRGQGIGQCLAGITLDFARVHGYEKVVIYVLAHNDRALNYYQNLGFEERGILKRQTKIDDQYFDEIFMELLFEEQEP